MATRANSSTTRARLPTAQRKWRAYLVCTTLPAGQCTISQLARSLISTTATSEVSVQIGVGVEWHRLIPVKEGVYSDHMWVDSVFSCTRYVSTC
ncbi:hypothetical protein JG687_00000707 [Phytophthora cactorum]|uniref:Uncharacterized protein n=1 Tax=Phytophthora cactorum TaxID=29920 RepID=A0A8T1V2V3_9STRA|nr:hypothetical protein JG687_00000707 [Phytophthora cactorum]